MKRFIIFILFICFKNIFSSGSFNSEITNILPPKIVDSESPEDDFAMPEIKKSGEDIEGEDLRYLEKTYTVMMEAKVNVFIPLEVVSDINIEETIIGNQIKEIPFEIELNRTPEKKDYYSIKYSETVIDIDMDGKPDTYIYSPKYINEKISKDNYVKIYGENISKEGTHRKTIYVTVEVGE